MARPQLHLDADTSIKSLHQTLLARGHDVTRLPSSWMPLDAGDEDATPGRHRTGTLYLHVQRAGFSGSWPHPYPRHGGIILADQSSWSLTGLIGALDRLLTETDADAWPGEVRRLNQWRAR